MLRRINYELFIENDQVLNNHFKGKLSNRIAPAMMAYGAKVTPCKPLQDANLCTQIQRPLSHLAPDSPPTSRTRTSKAKNI